MTPYVSGPMYATYLHELTLKELKSLNSKLIKDPPKEEKEESLSEHQAPPSLNGHSNKIIIEMDPSIKAQSEEFLPPQ